MGWAERRLGKLVIGSPKDLHFQGFFGVLAEVAVGAWEMMSKQKCLPSNPLFLHYLWALAFMRTYPANDEALSRVLGGSDPKTIHKYMWPYINSIFELDEVLVCILFCCVSLLNEPLLTILIIQLNLSRLYLKTGRWGTSEMTVSFQWTAQTFASRWVGQSFFMIINSRGADTFTR
jgi:hypothetical protein